MKKLRELHPKSSTYELSTKLKSKWYSMGPEKQKRLRTIYTRKTKDKYANECISIVDEEEL